MAMTKQSLARHIFVYQQTAMESWARRLWLYSMAKKLIQAPQTLVATSLLAEEWRNMNL
jgi:hypothetical protein